MYFPGPDSQSGLGSGSGHGSGSGSGHGSSKSSSKKSRSGSTGSPTKTNTTEDLSDTDTLIHNMSDGSYEKESLNDDHDSFGSAKGSRSSGNSSLSPHNR